MRVKGQGSRVQGVGFSVQGSGSVMQGAGCRVQGAGVSVVPHPDRGVGVLGELLREAAELLVEALHPLSPCTPVLSCLRRRRENI